MKERRKKQAEPKYILFIVVILSMNNNKKTINNENNSHTHIAYGIFDHAAAAVCYEIYELENLKHDLALLNLTKRKQFVTVRANYTHTHARTHKISKSAEHIQQKAEMDKKENEKRLKDG